LVKPFRFETFGQQVDAMGVQDVRFPVHYESQNVWADLLTSWAVRSAPRLARSRVSLIMLVPVTGADDPVQEHWLSIVSVVEEQRKILSNRPDRLRYDADLLVHAEQRLWVPNAAVELKQRILIPAHAGPAGLRGAMPTRLLLVRHFLWSKARKEIDASVQICLIFSFYESRVGLTTTWRQHTCGNAESKQISFYWCWDSRINVT
jgi:hypothetical protein